MKKNKKQKKLIPQLKKDLSDFCVKEEGKIEKKMLAKLGIALAMLAVSFEQTSYADHANYDLHSNVFRTSGRGYHESGITNHGSHGSHGSHGQW